MNWPTDALRRGLLSVPGIGPETADSILLYAAEREVFVVDRYTRRILKRLGRVCTRTFTPCSCGTPSAIVGYNLSAPAAA